jgi:hypothetical protein
MQWRDRQIGTNFNHGKFGIFDNGITHHCVVHRLKLRWGSNRFFHSAASHGIAFRSVLPIRIALRSTSRGFAILRRFCDTSRLIVLGHKRSRVQAFDYRDSDAEGGVATKLWQRVHRHRHYLDRCPNLENPDIR